MLSGCIAYGDAPILNDMAEAFLESIGIAELLPIKYQEGYTAGRNSMSGEYTRGYNAGYSAGYTAGKNSASIGSGTSETATGTWRHSGSDEMETFTHTLSKSYQFITFQLGGTFKAGNRCSAPFILFKNTSLTINLGVSGGSYSGTVSGTLRLSGTTLTGSIPANYNDTLWHPQFSVTSIVGY